MLVLVLAMMLLLMAVRLLRLTLERLLRLKRLLRLNQVNPKKLQPPKRLLRLRDRALFVEGKRFALITTIGGLGDGPIGDATYEGIGLASEELVFDGIIRAMSAPDYEAMIIEYAEAASMILIFLAGMMV
jgi:hypothetical protein